MKRLKEKQKLHIPKRIFLFYVTTNSEMVPELLCTILCTNLSIAKPLAYLIMFLKNLTTNNLPSFQKLTINRKSFL